MKRYGIIQARVHSTRLPRKMFAPIGGKTLIQWAWDRAVVEFGTNTMIACPLPDVQDFQDALPKARIWGYDGDENDVLGRIVMCARAMGADPHDVVVRLTPDDWPLDCERDAYPFGRWRETSRTVKDPYLREHVTYALNPEARREINTEADWNAVRKLVEPF